MQIKRFIKMPNPTWDLLQKSQTDDETIEEAITRIVAEHGADEEAHLGVGESLQSHKASEIIDHMADSIIEDKLAARSVSTDKLLKYSRNSVFLNYESFDAWEPAGGLDPVIGELFLQTGNTINTVKYAFPYCSVIPKWTKDFIWQIDFQLGSNSDQTCYIVLGGIDINNPEDQAVGFKIENEKLYALHVVSDGSSMTEYKTEITGVTFTARHLYRVEFEYGYGFRFYIDDVFKCEQTTNLPSSTYPGATCLHVWIKNLAASNKSVNCGPVYFEQAI